MDMNDEMDELFRKAGEDYPLNLGRPDWDAVAGKLHTDTGGLGPGFGSYTAAPRKRRRYLWLLLLLLPAGIYGIMESDSRKAAVGDVPATVRGLKAGDSRAAGSRQQAGNANSNTFSDSNRIADITPASARGSATAFTGESRSTVKGKPADSGRGTTVDRTASHSSEDGGTKTPAGSTNNGNTNAVATNKNQPGRTGTTIAGYGKEAETTVIANGMATEEKNTDSAATTGSVAPGTEDNGSPLADIVMANEANNPVAGSRKKAMSPSVNKTEDKNDSLKDTKNKKPVIHPSVKQQRGFYAGVTAAPDFSTVKFQTMKSTGYGFGVVAGYRIDRHFSVETGLSWDRKKYYSKGEYFDKSKTKIPSNVDVTYIDGYCDMFEIPLTVRYDLTAGKRGHWFAAAGFSSYLMKNENYLYGAQTNNVPWSRYVDYKNSGNNFFSIIQFSAGYELNWTARNRIRIEPYFKAPLSGVGIGSLPLSSVGMTFGFIHSFR